jgi:hypothetical protein
MLKRIAQNPILWLAGMTLAAKLLSQDPLLFGENYSSTTENRDPYSDTSTPMDAEYRQSTPEWIASSRNEELVAAYERVMAGTGDDTDQNRLDLAYSVAFIPIKLANASISEPQNIDDGGGDDPRKKKYEFPDVTAKKLLPQVELREDGQHSYLMNDHQIRESSMPIVPDSGIGSIN